MFSRPDGGEVPVAVSGTIVGETVETGAIGRSPRGGCRREAPLLSVAVAAPGRTAPSCPHVGECGGCVWQHIDYPYQLQHKQAQLEKLFSPILSGTGTFHPIIGASSPWRYRNKMEFSFAQDRNGKRFVGLFSCRHRGEVFDLTACLLTGEWMAEAVRAIKEWWLQSGLDAYYLYTDRGSLQTVAMRESATTGDRMVLLTVSGNPAYALRKEQLTSFVEALQRSAAPAQGTLSIVLRIKQIAKGRPTQFYEMMLHGPDHIREVLTIEPIIGKRHTLEVHVGPQSFFQPNTIQAMTIYSRALQLARLSNDHVVADLYCGIGIFGMAASLEARQAIGVELSRESAYDAKTNASRLGLERFSILCGDVADVIRQQNFAKPSTVIVDPPRPGLTPQALSTIVSLEPDTIIYVSCNPETQLRDAKLFVEKGWKADAVQPVDQFPHTVHVENILRLSR